MIVVIGERSRSKSQAPAGIPVTTSPVASLDHRCNGFVVNVGHRRQLRMLRIYWI